MRVLKLERTSEVASSAEWPNPSFKRRANGMPSLALISLWASAVLPLSPA